MERLELSLWLSNVYLFFFLINGIGKIGYLYIKELSWIFILILFVKIN